MIEAVSPYKVMNPITYFLNMFNFNEKYNSKIDNALRKKIVIKPTIDDRMYTYALINDWHVMTRNNQDLTREELYELGFIDVRSCSCPDDKMREEIMDRCCYRRWLTYGTLDIITHHSFVRITGADNEDDKKGVKNAVIRPFLIQYNQMAQIALAQRATLLAMTDMASKISTGKGKSKNLNELHTKWVKALSQMMLSEVTVQEQGVEEFNMMRNEFYIPESMGRFEKQLEALYQKEENKKGHLLNGVLLVLAVAQAVGVLIPYIIDWFGDKAKLIKNEVELIGNRIRPIEIQMKLMDSEPNPFVVWGVLLAYLLVIIGWVIYFKIRKKK